VRHRAKRTGSRAIDVIDFRLCVCMCVCLRVYVWCQEYVTNPYKINTPVPATRHHLFRMTSLTTQFCHSDVWRLLRLSSFIVLCELSTRGHHSLRTTNLTAVVVHSLTPDHLELTHRSCRTCLSITRNTPRI